MTDQTSADAILSLLSAALAFLDTDAAFGVDHERTREAKSRLRGAVEAFMATAVADPPQLRVVRGRLGDGE